MARVARLAGALLLETGLWESSAPSLPTTESRPAAAQYYLIGNPKEPCDFATEGFEPPGEIDAVRQPYLQLHPTRLITLTPPWLELELEGVAAAELLAERLLISRNGSVSDRLWRIITHPEAPEEPTRARAVAARWLAEMPRPVWNIVRDTVLRCS